MAKLQLGLNDLGTVRPDLAAQLVDPSQAETVTAGSKKELLWVCETGHQRYEWEATVVDRSSKGRGCGVCAGQVLRVGLNDLGTVRPDLAEQLVDPSQAETVTAGSTRKLLWFCETGHQRYEWETQVHSRSNGSGCGACAGKGRVVLLVGWNDLGTVRPDLAEQLVDPSLTTTVTKGSNKKLLWFCETGHPRYEWWATVNGRSRGYGCSLCAKSGYDSSKPGAFYRFTFTDSDGSEFLCYGITNRLRQRQNYYKRNLEIKNFQSIHFEDGAIPQKLEKQFHQIRIEAKSPAPKCGVDGTKTESFPITDIELATVFEAHWLAAAEKATSFTR